MNDPTLRRTPLFDTHLAAGAKMAGFAGWAMPIRYGSQIDEHHAVRNHAGMFDVSHMTIVDIEGTSTLEFLQHLVANDAGKLKSAGGGLYGVLLNEAGGIIDDVIVYRRDRGYRVVSNAATRDAVMDWYKGRADRFDAVLVEREDVAMIAVQGPEAIARFVDATGLSEVAELKRFHALDVPHKAATWMIARTGYTGEDGIEVMLPARGAPWLWCELAQAGVVAAGLGARDTLRLEAGLNLYGQDMDETTTPLESNLGWTVAFEPADRDFIGRTALEAQRTNGVGNKLTGIALEDRGVMRHGMKVITEAGEGEVRSGIFSPTLGYSIGLARVPRAATGEVGILIRGRERRGRIVRPPFVAKKR
ncbi:MAG: glycine cleavage system aminomethyltransferase GcvT [Gammaproteobacteria bacterium]|nr:glycine cleavage system aminomethyltransferase GcvT [Gammaproteobacteria bacterium]